jgi:hypothetical protein
MAVGPPVTRRPRAGLVAAIAALVVVIGVIIIVNVHTSGSASGTHSVSYLKSALDKVPVPTGAVLVDEIANEEHGDLNAYVERRYRMASAAEPSEQVRAALQKGNCRLIDAQSGQAEAITASAWASQVSPASGDLNILPPGVTGGGIEVQWKGTSLYVSAKGGDVELS